MTLAAMRLAGFLLLPAGWAIALASLALLGPSAARIGFLLAGTAVVILGWALAARSHLTPREDDE